MDVNSLPANGWDVAAWTVGVRMFLTRLNPDGIYSQHQRGMVRTKEGGNSL